MHVVVVGSGIAGLTAAIRASARHDVTLVTKGALADSATSFAQGGVAVALGADDSAARHIADTHRAGAGSTGERAVDILCTDGPARVRDLLALGVPFDRTLDAESIARFGDDLARGREAAHGRWRVIHADGDATGSAIERTLISALNSRHVTILERTFLVDLVMQEGAVRGVELLDLLGEPTRLDADAVIIASGGAGHLYRRTTNPLVATGDGQAAAFRAGAVLADVEFVQFHPTRLATPNGGLVSEAVRGEGAVLFDGRGRRFMADEHPDAELAPRDVVARGIARALRETEGPVLLDATALERSEPGFLERRFPGLTTATRAAGFDWRREGVPVEPAAHYSMGGIATDVEGRTSLPGLFAVGEAACTGVHGANRLASNSLLEGLVFAVRAADALDAPRPAVVEVRGGSHAEDIVANVPDLHDDGVHLHDDGLDGILPGEETAAPEAAGLRSTLQSVMEDGVGLLRDASGLAVAKRRIDAILAPAPTTVAEFEDRNLRDLASVMVRAAETRTESRGAHARTDHPETDPAQAAPRAWRRVVHERIPA